MLTQRLIIPLLILAFAQSVVADEAHPANMPDLTALLSPPPANGSVAAQNDLQAVLAAQSARSAADASAAEADAERSIFRFADVLGPRFQPAQLPRTAAFFERVAQFDKADVKLAKSYWRHPRPGDVSTAVHPLDKEKANDWSYPSGHATFGYSAAVLLANMLPEKRAAIFARADEYAQHRIVIGAHFPSDIEAGRVAGTVIAAQLLGDPTWRADYRATCAELRKALAATP